MRSRLLSLLLLASLLGTPVLLHRANVADRCATLANDALCTAVQPDPLWVRPFGLLSATLLVLAAGLFARAWSERRRERLLLEGVGVRVREQDLPLEE